MRISVSLLAKLAVAVVVAMAGTAVAGTAPASASVSQCSYLWPTGYFCVWEHQNFSGGFKQWNNVYGCQDGNYDNNTFDNGVPVNDRVTGYFNRSDYTGHLHEHANYGGQYVTIQPWAQISVTVLNDRASSHHLDCGGPKSSY
jgi:Peptidase inhibitor family I36